MATTQLSKLTVKALTKYGFQDESGEYIGWSKNLKDAEKVSVVPGRTINFELYIADSGKKYVNKVLNAVETADVPLKSLPKVTIEQVQKVNMNTFKKALSNEMSKDEWAAKDHRISRQGVIQAAVQAVSPMYSDVDTLYQAASELADKMLNFVNEK